MAEVTVTQVRDEVRLASLHEARTTLLPLTADQRRLLYKALMETGDEWVDQGFITPREWSDLATAVCIINSNEVRPHGYDVADRKIIWWNRHTAHLATPTEVAK